MESAQEEQFIKTLCGNETVWIGATDEAAEGRWIWVTGSKVAIELKLDNGNDIDHWAAIYKGDIHDGSSGNRWVYICEWE